MTEKWHPPADDPLRMPPGLPDETDEQYTDRLTGADGTNRVPYAERRYRQCSIGYHDECSDRRRGYTGCDCPCHGLPDPVWEALSDEEERDLREDASGARGEWVYGEDVMRLLATLAKARETPRCDFDCDACRTDG